MVAVSAVAFGAGSLCLYYGARDLRTRRAIRRLKSQRDTRGDASPERTDAPPVGVGRSTARPDGPGTSAANDADPPGDPVEDVAIERGFALLALGGLCLLFGALAL